MKVQFFVEYADVNVPWPGMWRTDKNGYSFLILLAFKKRSNHRTRCGGLSLSDGDQHSQRGQMWNESVETAVA